MNLYFRITDLFKKQTFNIYFWLRFIFVYQKSLKQTFQTGFWVKNHHWNICFRVVNSQRLFVYKKLVWNVCMKYFWHTKKVFYIPFVSSQHENTNSKVIWDFWYTKINKTILINKHLSLKIPSTHNTNFGP